MCGIIGVINGEKGWAGLHSVNNYMREGAVTGLFRGEDSTGMLQVENNKNVKILKSTVDGYYFAQQKNVLKALSNVDSCPLTVIHHRAATKGSVSYNNTHPFDHEVEGGRYVAGVHNGTIHQFKRNEDGKTFEVDSDWLYYRIAKLGGVEALEDIGDNGAYALVWYEQQEGKVMIAANMQRPIHWANVKGKNVILIASEAEMLYWLARRNHIELENMLYPPKNTVWEFDPTGDLTKPIKHDIHVKEKPVVNNQQRHNQGYTRETKDKSGHNIIVNDTHGPSALSGTRFSHLEEVEFVYSHHESSGRWERDSNVEIFGEIISATAVVAEAVISGATKDTLENMLDSDSVLVKSVGHRRVVDKDTGDVTNRILCAPPHFLIKDDNKEEKEEAEAGVPFGESSSEELFEIPTVRGPGGKDVSVVKFMELVKHGCGLCSNDLSLKDAPSILWAGEKDPLCASCAIDFTKATYA